MNFQTKGTNQHSSNHRRCVAIPINMAKNNRCGCHDCVDGHTHTHTHNFSPFSFVGCKRLQMRTRRKRNQLGQIQLSPFPAESWRKLDDYTKVIKHILLRKMGAKFSGGYQRQPVDSQASRPALAPWKTRRARSFSGTSDGMSLAETCWNHQNTGTWLYKSAAT